MGSKTIFNSTSMEVAQELLYRHLGVRLDPAFVQYALDTTNAVLTVTALSQAADGRRAEYAGTVQFPYRKLDLSQYIAHDIVYGDVYPTTFERLQSYLRTSYDYLMEEGEFYLANDGSKTPLVAGSVIDADTDTLSRVTLMTTGQAGRWQADKPFYFRPLQSNSLQANVPLTLTGHAPDGTAGNAYSYAYQVNGGRPPYTFTIAVGQAPAPIDPDNGVLLTSALSSTGAFTWTVEVVDSHGTSTTLEDSCEITATPIALMTHMPSVAVTTAFDVTYVADGGVPPYTFTAVGSLPAGLTLTPQGRVTGYLDVGSTNVGIRVTDAVNTVVEITDTYAVTGRSDSEIANLWLTGKLQTWTPLNDHIYDAPSADPLKYPTAVGYGDEGGIANTEGAYLQTDGSVGMQASPISGNLATLAYSAEFNQNGASGYFEDPYDDTCYDVGDDFAIVFWAKTAAAQPNRTVLGRWNGAGGYRISTDAASGNKLTLSLNLDGQPYSITSPTPYNDNVWHLHVVQKYGQTVEFIQDLAQTVVDPTLPSATVDQQTEVAFALGTQSDNPGGGLWSGALSQFILLRGRLWGDERAWLRNGGKGRTYADLMYESGRYEYRYNLPQDLEGGTPLTVNVTAPSDEANPTTGTITALNQYPLVSAGLYGDYSDIEILAGTTDSRVRLNADWIDEGGATLRPVLTWEIGSGFTQEESFTYVIGLCANDSRITPVNVTFNVSPPVLSNFVAYPLTYSEVDYAGTMTWTRQGNGPHVTPEGFEGDGYEARLKSTTIPAWMSSASAPLTLHGSMSFYPQQLKSTSEFALFAGTNTTSPAAKLIFQTRVDVNNANIAQAVMRVGTTGTSFVESNINRSQWRYELRTPELSYAGNGARPQALVFPGDGTVLLTVHFEETRTRVYRINLSDYSVAESFDATGDFAHMAAMAYRSNGDLWIEAASNKACRVDLAASFQSGTLVTLDVLTFTGLVAGALDFVTISGTEYAIIPEYATSGAPYFYVFTANQLTSGTLDASARYKRFTGAAIEIQGCVMRSGLLLTSSIARMGTGTGSRYGYIDAIDILPAITSAADGSALTSMRYWDAASKYVEDLAIHPVTGDVWCPTEGIESVGSSVGGLAVWSSPLDDSLVENHYTMEYDGNGTTTVKVNHQLFDTLSGTTTNPVQVVCVGGPPVTGAGMSNRYFTGYMRNVVLQDEPLTTAQYTKAVSGEYESNTLTTYELVLTNPGAESGLTAIGWTNEVGGLGVRTGIPAHTGDNNFSGGTSASTIARQRLDLTTQTGLTGTQLDAGGIWAKVRWWQSSYDSATDPAGMGLRTLTAANATVVEAYAGIVWTPNATGSSGSYPWYPRAFAASLTSGTRNLDVLQKITRTNGTNNDGWIDDVRVTLYRQN